MSATAETIRRLVLIRLLLSRAEENARLSPPFSTDSVNRLHDVVEMFLALAAQEHHVGIPRDFLGYWDVLEQPLGRPLAYRAQMQKLNKVRVNLKHYGVEPAKSEIQAAVAAVRGLLEDECEDLFGIALEDVSLVDVVTEPRARALLETAEARWATRDKTGCFADLAEAFEIIVRDYADRKRVWFGRSVFDSTEDMRFLSPLSRRFGAREQARFEEAVIESLKALDFKVMIVGLGVDLRRYGKFRALTPSVSWTLNGKRHVSETPGIQREQADFEFCRDFVISTAIHLDEFDYDFDLWTTSREASAENRPAAGASSDMDTSGGD